MKEALKEAKKAYKKLEVPVGAIIVKDDKIIARGYNKKESSNNCIMHAEIDAIKKASKALDNWRLNDCEMYVTLEPCVMCAGAIGWSQISRVVYGATDEKRGYHTYCSSPFHKKTTITGGVLEQECSKLMTDFFKKKR